MVVFQTPKPLYCHVLREAWEPTLNKIRGILADYLFCPGWGAMLQLFLQRTVCVHVSHAHTHMRWGYVFTHARSILPRAHSL